MKRGRTDANPPGRDRTFRSIGEVSADLGESAHVLRFWESNIPQLRPMRMAGRRRRYRQRDVRLLKGVQILIRQQGRSLQGVRRHLAAHGVEAVRRLADAAAECREDETRRQALLLAAARLRECARRMQLRRQGLQFER